MRDEIQRYQEYDYVVINEELGRRSKSLRNHSRKKMNEILEGRIRNLENLQYQGRSRQI